MMYKHLIQVLFVVGILGCCILITSCEQKQEETVENIESVVQEAKDTFKEARNTMVDTMKEQIVTIDERLEELANNGDDASQQAIEELKAQKANLEVLLESAKTESKEGLEVIQTEFKVNIEAMKNGLKELEQKATETTD